MLSSRTSVQYNVGSFIGTKVNLHIKMMLQTKYNCIYLLRFYDLVKTFFFSKTLTYNLKIFKFVAEIITQPQDTTCIEGDDIKFDCEVLGSHSIPTWSKNGQEVRSDDQIKIESKNTTHTLAIPQVTKEDSGLYTMEIGDKRCEVYLNVEGKYI